MATTGDGMRDVRRELEEETLRVTLDAVRWLGAVTRGDLFDPFHEDEAIGHTRDTERTKVARHVVRYVPALLDRVRAADTEPVAPSQERPGGAAPEAAGSAPGPAVRSAGNGG